MPIVMGSKKNKSIKITLWIASLWPHAYLKPLKNLYSTIEKKYDMLKIDDRYKQVKDFLPYMYWDYKKWMHYVNKLGIKNCTDFQWNEFSSKYKICEISNWINLRR